MKLVTMISLLLLSTTAYSNCECIALKNGKFYYQSTSTSLDECKIAVQEFSYSQYKNDHLCSGNNSNVSFEVSCQKKYKKPVYVKSPVDCSELNGMMNVESLLDSVMYTTIYTQNKNIDPTKEVTKDSDCLEQMSQELEMNDKQIKITSSDTNTHKEGLKLTISNKDELTTVMEQVIPGFKAPIPGEMLDKINNFSISFSLHNDNNLMDLQEGGTADDVGNTHGINLVFSKSLGEGGYVLDISYDSSLHTNFENPTDKGFYKDEFGNWHVSQYFIEENIGKLVLRKQKSGDAFYWSVGGGVHELNKKDGGGSLGLLSALGSQVAFHEYMSEVKPGSARLYDNLGQPGSELEAMIEITGGKRHTFFQDTNKRAFVEMEAHARLTGVNDASYVGASIAPYLDYQITDNTAIRAGAGIKTKVYSNKDVHTATFIEVVAGSENFEAGFKYEMYQNDAPLYQNALPSSIYSEEFRTTNAPPAENIWTIFVKGKL